MKLRVRADRIADIGFIIIESKDDNGNDFHVSFELPEEKELNHHSIADCFNAALNSLVNYMENK